jgi:hypothetical protein
VEDCQGQWNDWALTVVVVATVGTAGTVWPDATLRWPVK